MEAIRSSETSVSTYKTALRHNPGDNIRHFHRCENLKSQILFLLMKIDIILYVKCVLYLSGDRTLHYRVHKRPPLGHILSQVNLVHIITPYLYIFNIILTSTPMFPKWSLPLRFST
jgi:hypothetical protein